MLPGPTIIRKYSACKGLFRQETILSGNTFGATIWTDGWCDAPMLPDQPWLVKCPACKACLWIDEQEVAGELDVYRVYLLVEENGGLTDALPLYLSTKADLHSALAGDLDEEKERYIRTRLWWAGNDPRRHGKTVKPLSERERENMAKLLCLHSENDPDDRITKAEVFRELGRFDECLALLGGPFDRSVEIPVATIRDLAIKTESSVALVGKGGPN